MPLSSTCNQGNCSLLPAAALALGSPRTREVVVHGSVSGSVVPVSCTFDATDCFSMQVNGCMASSNRVEAVVPVSILVYDVLLVTIALSSGRVEVSSAAAALIDCSNNCCVSLSIPVIVPRIFL